MSKLNLLTIGVVILAILAIIFLVLQTKTMLSNDQQGKVEEVEDAMQDRYSDDEEYNIDDETADLEDDVDENTEEISDETSEEANTPEGKKVNNAATATQDDNDNEIETYIDSEGEGDFLVIGGSFKLKHNAEIMVKMLQKKGYSDSRVALFNKGAYASVIVDRFESEAEAKRLAKELFNNHRIEAYVHKKR